MKIRYENDAARGPGNGLLIFSEGILPSGPWSVAIQNMSYHQFMTGSAPNKWVGERIFLPLEGEVDDSGALALRLGPALVDLLDQQDQYRVQLKGGEGEIATGRLEPLGAVAYSVEGSLDHTPDAPEARQAPEAPAQKTAPAEEPEPAPAKQAEPEAPEEAPENLQMPSGPPVETPQKKSGAALKIVAIALLALACLAWYLFDQRKADNGGAEAPAPRQEQEAAQPGPAAAPEQPKSAEERVRLFFNGQEVSPRAAVELARSLPKSSKEDQDAVYRLYYFTAQNGEPALLLEYASSLDPTAPQWGTIQKDAVMAYEIYKKAEAANMEGASESAHNLRSWLENQARNGNAQAGVWLRELPK